MDADATDEQIAKATEIEQFSDEYFKLLKDVDEESKQYLAEEMELLVVLQGKAYRIVPPKSNR